MAKKGERGVIVDEEEEEKGKGPAAHKRTLPASGKGNAEILNLAEHSVGGMSCSCQVCKEMF